MSLITGICVYSVEPARTSVLQAYHRGNLIEKTMSQVSKSRKSSILTRGINWLLLRRILTDQVILSGLVGTMRIYQKIGMHKLVSALKVLHLIPGNLGSLHDSMPRIPDNFFSRQMDKPIILLVSLKKLSDYYQVA
ncbi:MAG: hypothetical protein CM1200mP8_5260 [Chloroflexota bacterium]|nr:MAG: hypothetical protein CM1200mP8_5260 [Chloroflexota bacterium]